MKINYTYKNQWIVNSSVAAFFIFLVIFVVTNVQLEKFPEKNDILPQLYSEPVQKPTNAKPFTLIADSIEYLIEPLYEYELHGMIVSYNQTSISYGISHWFFWRDFINIKDVCVIWGDNITNEVYKGMDFSSGSYTCYPRCTKGQYGNLYKSNKLSNNHLLSVNKTIKNLLWKSIVGDQIYLKGYLVKYSSNNGRSYRGTSTTRTDNGCETIFLTDFKILKKNHVVAKKINEISLYLMIMSLLIYLWLDPLWEQFKHLPPIKKFLSLTSSETNGE